MQINDLAVITSDVVETAGGTLVVGATWHFRNSARDLCRSHSSRSASPGDGDEARQFGPVLATCHRRDQHPHQAQQPVAMEIK